MARLAILEHNEHTLIIDDVSEETLERYNGDEQAYIDDNYDMENYSWDYITDTKYFPEGENNPCEIKFENCI